jgi:predicted CoA-binding protein
MSAIAQTRKNSVCANVVQIGLENRHRAIIGMSKKPQRKSNQIHAPLIPTNPASVI